MGVIATVQIGVGLGTNTCCTSVSTHFKSLLHVACMDGHIEALKMLLNCEDININIADNEGTTPRMKISYSTTN
jgi:hypothetical protein